VPVRHPEEEADLQPLVSLDHPEPLEEGMVFALETYWPASDGWSATPLGLRAD